MALFTRRQPEPVSVESEHERLRAIRLAAEEELGRLRKELSERVAAVEQRERELADAVAKLNRSGGNRPAPAGADDALAHAQVGLAARAQELSRREAELAAREKAYLEMETDLARRHASDTGPSTEERLAQIEERLATLQEAEKAFARTQAELAARSEELARRETELRERERAGAAPTSAGAGAAGGLSRPELDELDERIRRLERETREAYEGTFDDGLRKLERRGLGGPGR